LPARVREVAQGHDASRIRAAAMQIQSRSDLAQYNYQTRWNLAQLAGAYHIQGNDETNSVKMAIAYLNGRVQVYTHQIAPGTGIMNPTMNPQDPTAGGPPAVQQPQGYYGSPINIYTSPPPVQYDKPPNQKPPNQNPRQPPRVIPPRQQNNTPQPLSQNAATAIQKIDGAPIASNKEATIAGYVQRGLLTPQDANMVRQHYGLPAAPLPLPSTGMRGTGAGAGGAPAGGPFQLVP
jgi:hypothetical protein